MMRVKNHHIEATILVDGALKTIEFEYGCLKVAMKFNLLWRDFTSLL
jgi:hypothetical protein